MRPDDCTGRFSGSTMHTLREQALAVVSECNPDRKAALARTARPDLPAGAEVAMETKAVLPGRPDRPPLVDHGKLSGRSVATALGRAALIHALAHIELNAIDLAGDAVWRFGGQPDAFYRDWTAVMREEALHFELLVAHLATYGCRYGDLPAHNGLWEMAERTRDDVLARMALVPRTLEARGLDASPTVRAKLQSSGDRAGAAIVDVLLRDEVGHVAIGNRWYAALCVARGLEPVATYAVLAAAYGAPRLRGPFNLDARRAAGFSEPELRALQDASR